MASCFPTDLVIVVGGGLAGVSACNTVVENGGRTVLIDKSSFCGGNSTKATSGINGAATRTQKSNGIEDSTELFTKDTLKGGAKKPEIVKVLCENSGRDVEWLMDVFKLDLSLVARLGGHSAPRTHRGKERFPGMTITYALIQMVEKIAETTDKARIITKAKATSLLQGPGKEVVGLIYEKGGVEFQEHGPVILCTGGFGADFTADSLLAKYRPDLLHLPTTNGEHCTGDGIKMGEAIGAKTIDLEWVQVHPTGLVAPSDADAKIKFLAAEALRGVGGIIFNKAGKRFCNELGRRDYVTGEMWKNTPPFRLVLNKAASDEIIWHCKHYTGRGVMRYYENGEALAQGMVVPLSVLEESHQAHYEAAKKTEKDPDGGSWPAYPSGKSWDECSGKTGSGKKFYHNIIPGSAVKSEPFYVAIITPVIHYCMGGLEINAEGGVLGATDAIPGLYCAGEVAGGVHGNNRLGGNSLLDCVVFGRVAGLAATKYILGQDAKKVDLDKLTGGGLDGSVKASKLSGGSYEEGMNDSKGGQAPAAPTKAKKEKKESSGAGTAVASSEIKQLPPPCTGKRRVLIVGGSFTGLLCARDLTHGFLTTVVDAKEFFEYTPGILRAYVKPKHFDALSFTLQPVIETKMQSKYIWGEVKQLNGVERNAILRPMFAQKDEMIDFDYCMICSGCNFGPFHKWGESLWFPTIHEAARKEGSWPQFDERFIEGRRRHILDEYKKVQEYNEKKQSIVVVGAGFIGVEWITELEHFFKDLKLTIIDFLPNCLGPLPKKAADYCAAYMEKQGIKQFYNKKYDAKSDEFWASIGFLNGTRPDKEYICIGVKASNYFMPPETLSEKGPGGGGWILIDMKLSVKTRDGGIWGADYNGQPRFFAVGDCNYSCVEEPGKKPNQWPIPPWPKISYPGEEHAVIACCNLEKVDKLCYHGRKDDCCGKPIVLNDMHWPWGAGMFATSLGPDDGCFVAGANWEKNSGFMVTWGSVCAVQKEIIEATITDEAQYGLIGRLIWHFVHHTPVHLFGGGPVWGYTW